MSEKKTFFNPIVVGEKLVEVNNIGIVVDDVSDLPEKIIKKYQLGCANFIVDWPEGEKLAGDNIYQKMREADKKGIQKLPKTSQPTQKAFLEAYKKTLEKLPKDSKIISIVLSSKLSGAYNSAYQASQMLGEPSKVYIFDSLQGSAGQALIILRAIELREEGKNFNEIIKELKKTIPKIQLLAVLKDPKWLESGGRISHSQATWIRRMEKLKIRPIIIIKDGKVEKGGIVLRASDLATAIFKKIKKSSAKDRKNNKKIRVVINHCDAQKEAEKLKKMLKEINAEVSYINLVSPVVGAHIGPSSLIAAWMTLD